MARALEGNSGTVDVVVVLVAAAAGVVVVVVLVVLVALVVVVVLMLVTVVVVEMVVVVVAEYVNDTTCVAVAPLPPQVAFTENVPLVQAAFPPG